MQNLINSHLPEGSTVTSATTTTLSGSTFLDIRFTVNEEFQTQFELSNPNRVLRIRVIKGEEDYGMPISGFADTN